MDILDKKEAQQWAFSKTEKGIKPAKKLQDRDAEIMLRNNSQHVLAPTVGKATL
jgi:hypothetical protein